MNKVIPIMPCPDVRAQAAFYQQLGFEVAGIYTSPNPYVALNFGTIDLHFYGTRRVAPEANSTMCFIQVDDVESVCAGFTAGLKQATGKVPRGGIPRISKVRDLKSDRRFTLTDPGGNTFYIGTVVSEEDGNFFRDLDNQEHAKNFGILYDLIYSKEDAEVASNMLPRLLAVKPELSDLDRARLLLVEVDIATELGTSTEAPTEELAALLAENPEGEGWNKIAARVVA